MVPGVGSSEKRRLRERMSVRRHAVEPGRALALAGEATRLLLEALEGLRPARVGLYAALRDELPTRPLFQELAERGTPRLLPRPLPDGRLAFLRTERWEDLVPGRFGVLEPPLGAEVELLEGDAVVAPGLAFDPGGHRLGRGRAYYDRTFPPDRSGAPALIGFAYEFQVVDRVPHDSHDRAMDAIVTERRVRWIGREPS